MRNSTRRTPGGPQRYRHDREHERNERDGGLAEIKAMADRMLETGARFLQQSREWLDAATHTEGAAGTQGREPRGEQRGQYRAYGSAESYGGGERYGPARHRQGGGHRPEPYGYAEGRWSTRGGYDYDDHGAREFDARAEELQRYREGTAARGDDYVPGSYGYGGEYRQAAGASPGLGEAGHGYGAGYRGQGPRGYTRRDERILEDVNERLADDSMVDATDIEVRCENGRVILEGRVPDRWMKYRAEDLADSIAGAKDIENRIQVARSHESPSQAPGATQAGPAGRPNPDPGQAGQARNQAKRPAQTPGSTGPGSRGEP